MFGRARLFPGQRLRISYLCYIPSPSIVLAHSMLLVSTWLDEWMSEKQTKKEIHLGR